MTMMLTMMVVVVVVAAAAIVVVPRVFYSFSGLKGLLSCML